MAARRRRRTFRPARPAGRKKRTVAKTETVQVEEVVVERPEKVTLAEASNVEELAELINMTGVELVGELFNRGIITNLNANLDFETAALMLADMDIEAELGETKVVEIAAPDVSDIPEVEGETGPRAPVVTVMGHVDHGKTTLLDAIRKSNVVAGEAGGITQGIGAYQVEVEGSPITFIDTPGHEAFTAMRARGAQVTDIVVLVVAADDGVMPQTREAIAHAKAADVPIIVAVNKADLPGANIPKVLSELANANLLVESMGGDVVSVEISALKGEGIDDLLEMIHLTTEIEPPVARLTGPARSSVIETRLDRSVGPVATVLVAEGQLRVGDAYVVGLQSGRARSLVDADGNRVKVALAGHPVEVVGLSGMPRPGDDLAVVDNEKQARQIAEARGLRASREDSTVAERLGLEDLARQLTHGAIQQLDLVVKADTDGSVEAVVQAIEALGYEKAKPNVVFSGVGAITENDVNLAIAAQGVVIAFNVKASPAASGLAVQNGVEIRSYQIIYDVINDVDSALQGKLEPEISEVIDGRLEVRGVFRTERALKIIGGIVSEGRMNRGAEVRVIRAGETIATARIDTLRRFSDTVNEVTAGYECGLGITVRPRIEEGDILEAFHEEEGPPIL